MDGRGMDGAVKTLSDADVFGPDAPEKSSSPVDLSPLEKAFEQIAEGARSQALGAAKATIDEAASRFEKVTASIKETNAKIVEKAVEAALEKIAAGTRVDTSTIREIVGTIKMPDLSGLESLREDLARVGKLVEGTHGAIASSIRALREDLIAAMRTELKVEVKAPEAPPEKPKEWQFEVHRDDAGEIKSIDARARDDSPRTVLEAARRAA